MKHFIHFSYDSVWNPRTDGGAARLPEIYAALRANAWKRCAEFTWPRMLPMVADWLEAQARGSSR